MRTKNEYLYVQGTSTDLIKNPDKKGFCTELDHARDALVKITGEIIVPRFIGVYQARSATGKAEELEQAAIFSFRESLRADILRRLAMETVRLEGKDGTTLQPAMISVLYDPKQGDLSLVRLLFKDPLQRITAYPANEAPNFGNKDPSLKELIAENVKEIVTNERSYDEQIRLLRSNLDLMEQDRKKYGLTLEEWMFLHISREMWGFEADIQKQKKAIIELRAAYEAAAKNKEK